MHTRYEREAYQFLAVYRFLAYALAVMFTQIAPFFTAPRMPPLQLYIILSTLGVYTILKVFSPLQWRERSPMTYLILIGDFLLSILLVIYTNGLNSSFLLYSLTPIMTAALLFEEKIALALAATASLALSISHIALSQFTDMFASIMQGHNLTLLIVYTLFCFVVATVPYRINLNIRRRIEREAIIEERRRIAREIHDGVAQSLSYLNMKTKTVSDLLSSQNTMQALTEINEIREVVQDTYEDIRESIDQLRGLKGEEIPLEARILAIADAFAAMTSTRSYSEALSLEEALKELRQSAGKQFDPHLVEVFCSAIEAAPVTPGERR